MEIEKDKKTSVLKPTDHATFGGMVVEPKEPTMEMLANELQLVHIDPSAHGSKFDCVFHTVAHLLNKDVVSVGFSTNINRPPQAFGDDGGLRLEDIQQVLQDQQEAFRAVDLPDHPTRHIAEQRARDLAHELNTTKVGVGYFPQGQQTGHVIVYELYHHTLGDNGWQYMDYQYKEEGKPAMWVPTNAVPNISIIFALEPTNPH